jgi:predicted hydrocarbon binding protein/Mn-dependent DtxR family transcriptional regulator
MKKIQQQILELLKKSESSGSDVAQKLGINRLTITKYLNVIHALGIIDFKTVGRAKIWFLKDTSSEGSKSKVRDAIEQYKESLDIQKKILEYLKNNPYGQAWESIARDLNMSKETIFLSLKVLKNNDMISYRDKGNRLWYINYFPSTKQLSETDIEELKYKIVQALIEKPQPLSTLSEFCKIDIAMCAKIIGILKDQNLLSYNERGGTKIWSVHKDLNTDSVDIKKENEIILLNNQPAAVINQSFVVGLYLTFNKEMIRRIGYFQGLYNTRMKKYSLKTYDKDQLFTDQISSYLKTGFGDLKSIRAKPFRMTLEKSFIGFSIKESLPQFSGDCVCTLVAGYIEGIYEAIYGNKVQVSEIKCVAKDDAFCEFVIE